MSDRRPEPAYRWPDCYRAFRLLQPTWVVALVTGLVVLALVIPQSGEALYAAAHPADGGWWPLLAVYASTAMLALTSWFSARVLLYVDYRRTDGTARVPREVAVDEAGERIRRYAARAYGLVPVVAVAGGFARAAEWLHVAGMVVLGVAFLAFVVLRRRLWLGDPEGGGEDRRPVDWVETLPRASILGAVSVLGVNALFFFAVLILPVGAARYTGAVGIVLIACAGWVVVGSALVHVGHRVFYRRYWPAITPFVLLGLATVAAGLGFADNHPVRTVARQAPSADATLAEHFRRWRDVRRAAGQGAAPIVLVTAEGGGIRAAYWTASVLAHLSENVPGFACRVYAISGASGGSVGAAIWLARMAEEFPETPTDCFQATSRGSVAAVQDVFAEDLLSPVVAALLTRDLVGHYLPSPLRPWDDRAAVFERGLEDAWARHAEGEAPLSLDQAFGALWADGRDPYLPSLVINTTREANGGPAAISNLAWSPTPLGAGPGAPPSAHPLRGRSGHDFPISTAIHAGARFPLVSPAGTLRCRDVGVDDGDCAGAPDAEWDRIADGGYFDNSGAFTALELRRWLEAECTGDCRFVHLAISNDIGHPDVDERCDHGLVRRPPKKLGLNPVDTYLRGATAWQRVVERRFRTADGHGPALAPLCPNPERRDPALGWLLDERSQAWMNEQAVAAAPVDTLRALLE